MSDGRKKARVIAVGRIDEEGRPQGWAFDCAEGVPGFSVGEEGVRWGGYDLEELREMARRVGEGDEKG